MTDIRGHSRSYELYHNISSAILSQNNDAYFTPMVFRGEYKQYKPLRSSGNFTDFIVRLFYKFESVY